MKIDRCHSDTLFIKRSIQISNFSTLLRYTHYMTIELLFLVLVGLSLFKSFYIYIHKGWTLVVSNFNNLLFSKKVKTIKLMGHSQTKSQDVETLKIESYPQLWIRGLLLKVEKKLKCWFFQLKSFLCMFLLYLI